MKYKVGDRVRIKPTLNEDDTTPDCWVSAKMITKRGQIYPIVKITSCGIYGLDLDNGKDGCWFTEDMLEPADSKTLRMADGTIIGEFAKEGIIGEFKGIPIYAIPKEEKNLKFTFYVTDWVDINKTNGEKIPMKRTVAYIGSNTDVEADTSCPVAEYDERIGCLIAAAKISAKRSTEAKMMYNIARSTWGTELSWAILFELANAAFNGNFERAYKKFHNDNIRFEKKRLTCNFCGKVFETIEEKTKHENEHIQNKKNKREKYLIRKEAKRRLAEAEREGKIEQTMKELYKK